MKKQLLLYPVLALTVTGCRTLGMRPDPAACPEPTPAPQAPPVTPLPPGGELPKGANHVVIGLCPATGAYLGMGINTKTRSYTYAVAGGRATRETYLANVYRSGVPVVVFTAPVKASGAPRGRTVGEAAAGAAGATSTGTGSEEGDATFDPCTDIPGIGDEPPPDPKDTGGAIDPVPQSFTDAAWQSANAVDGATDAAAASGTAPAPTTPR